MIKDKRNTLLDRFTPDSLSDSTYWASKGKTYDFNELTDSQIESIYYLFYPKQKPKTESEKIYEMQLEQELKRLRSYILSDAQYVGLYTPGDWAKFNNFMKKISVLKKPLKDYDITEFPLLIKQFKSIRHKFDNSKTKAGTKAWYQMLGLKPSLN